MDRSWCRLEIGELRIGIDGRRLPECETALFATRDESRNVFLPPACTFAHFSSKLELNVHHFIAQYINVDLTLISIEMNRFFLAIFSAKPISN